MAGVINESTLKGGLFETSSTQTTQVSSSSPTSGSAELRDLTDVETFGAQAQNVLRYDDVESQWLPHTLTTTSLADVDNTSVSDGSVFLYNGSAQKYVATNDVANQNLFIRGGSY